VAVPRQIALLQGSKWTSEVSVEGWRHFEVIGLERTDEGWSVELAASCDATRRVQVNARALMKREGWRAGWTMLRALEQLPVTPRPSP
jgi:tryptophan-rich hypothetical protein